MIFLINAFDVDKDIGGGLTLVSGWILLAAAGITGAGRSGRADLVTLVEDAVDDSAGGLSAFKIETTSATYYLEKTGAGLSSMIDREENDWLGFHPEPGSRAGGEFRGFPNAVHQQAGNYFHPKNQGTEVSSTRIEYAESERAAIPAVSGNNLWRCRYDFHLTKYLDSTPQRFSIAFVESVKYVDIAAAAARILREGR